MSNINTELDIHVKKSQKNIVARILKRYFKVRWEDLIQGVDLASEDLLQFELLEQFGFHEVFYTNSLPFLPFNEMSDGDKLIHSPVYKRFVEQEALVDKSYQDLYLMALVMNSDIWVMYRDLNNGYRGLGGFYVTTEEGGLIFEPIKNYLKSRYPDQGEDYAEVD